MRVTKKQLTVLIQEMLSEGANDGAHGGAGTIGYLYHNSKDGPDLMIDLLANGKFAWNPNSYSDMYTQIDEPSPNMQRRGKRKGRYNYGDFIYKLRVNFHGALIFHRELAQTVYGKNSHPADQVMLITGNQHVAKAVRRVVSNTALINQIDPDRNQSAMIFLREIEPLFKFIVLSNGYTTIRDVNVFKPVAWKEGVEGEWNKVDTEVLRNKMSDTSTGQYGLTDAEPLDYKALDKRGDNSEEWVERIRLGMNRHNARLEAERLSRNEKARARRLAKKIAAKSVDSQK